MEVLTIQDKNGNIQKLPVPTHKSEVTLRAWQKVMKLSLDEDQIDSDLQDLAMEKLSIDPKDYLQIDEIEERELEKLLAKSICVIAQLEEVVAKEYHPLLRNFKLRELLLIRDGMQQTSTKLKDGEFKFVYALKHDIEDVKNELKRCSTFEFGKKKRFKEKLKLLESGKFWTVPAARVAFESRIATDTIRQTFKTLPEEVEKFLEEKNVTLEDYIAQREGNIIDKPVIEAEEELKFIKLIKTYLAELNENVYDNMHKLICHCTLPLGQEEYSFQKAKRREEYFLDLSVDVAESIIGFFLLLQDVWKKNTEAYSTKKVRDQLLNFEKTS